MLLAGVVPALVHASDAQELVAEPKPDRRILAATAAGLDMNLHKVMLRLLAWVALILVNCAWAGDAMPDAQAYAREVDRRLELPLDVQAAYAQSLEAALARAGIVAPGPQYFVLVDRSRYVQAALVYWRAPDGAWEFIGASPVSTGRPGEFEHFLTPLGVFEHKPANPDFRAEGTRNANGIMGYGRSGMRVFDFGWVTGQQRTWGARGPGEMRLQLHATDPQLLEPFLGTWHSKGCIRIPASLDDFIDRHGLLDADYEAGLRAGQRYWMLRADRTPTATPGRWLVVIETQRAARPAWSPLPRSARRADAEGDKQSEC
jgi:hypothetical protein